MKLTNPRAKTENGRTCGLCAARNLIRRIHSTGNSSTAEQAPDEPLTGEAYDPPPSTHKDTLEHLPAPIEHRSPHELVGLELPTLLFVTLDRRCIDLRSLTGRGLVLYVFPGCGPPDSPGAEADRRRHRAFASLRRGFANAMPGGTIVGLTSLNPLEQFRRDEALAWTCADDGDCPHHLVSDETWQAAQDLGLPTFETEGRDFYDPVTIVARDYRVQKVFHPADTGRDAEQALTWLRAN